jgi:hypothetical protein
MDFVFTVCNNTAKVVYGITVLSQSGRNDCKIAQRQDPIDAPQTERQFGAA